MFRRLSFVVALATVFVLAIAPLASATIANTGDVRIVQIAPSDTRVHPGQMFTITIRSENKGPSSTLWDLSQSVPDWFTVIDTHCALGISSDGTFCEYGADPDPHLGEDLATIYTVQVFSDSVTLGPTNVTFCATSEEGAFVDRNLANNCKSRTVTVIP